MAPFSESTYPEKLSWAAYSNVVVLGPIKISLGWSFCTYLSSMHLPGYPTMEAAEPEEIANDNGSHSRRSREALSQLPDG